ncbi:MAG TPA: hypothetical protein VK801_17145, partial [Caulobacteraceae bacterium]|nr:hypothetical protein [Caulobacteraceae bacterium]
MKSDCKTGASSAVLAIALLSLAPCASAQSTNQSVPQESAPLTATPTPTPTTPPPGKNANVSEIVVTA